MKERRPRNAGVRGKQKAAVTKRRSLSEKKFDGTAPRKRRSDAGFSRKTEKPETKFRDNNDKAEKPRRKLTIDDGRPERPKRRFEKDDSRPERPKRRFEKDDGRPERPKQRFEKDESRSERPKKRFEKDNNRPERPKRRFEKDESRSERPKRRFGKDDSHPDRPKKRIELDDSRPERPRRRFEKEDSRPERPRKRIELDDHRPERPKRRFAEEKGKGRADKPAGRSQNKDDGLIRLNKYIADAGVCSRRDADKLIESGAVKVNGVITSQLGTKVSREDKVQVGDQTLSREKLRYILLNKPKGYITTLEDPYERDTVIALVANACKERIYPVGRLDRNTTGVLLFTNDGDIAKKLTHPSHNIRKMYHVVLDQNLRMEDLEKIERGIELDDGFIKVDAIDYVGKDKSRKELGIELHSGKNRIVRRIFEQLGYNIVKLDRVVFAGLSKKDLPRGRWRHLTEKEVAFLKML